MYQNSVFLFLSFDLRNGTVEVSRVLISDCYIGLVLSHFSKKQNILFFNYVLLKLPFVIMNVFRDNCSAVVLFVMEK